MNYQRNAAVWSSLSKVPFNNVVSSLRTEFRSYRIKFTNSKRLLRNSNLSSRIIQNFTKKLLLNLSIVQVSTIIAQSYKKIKTRFKQIQEFFLVSLSMMKNRINRHCQLSIFGQKFQGFTQLFRYRYFLIQSSYKPIIKLRCDIATI